MAWAGGEIIQLLGKSERERYLELLADRGRILNDHAKGRLSDPQAGRALDDQARRARGNAYGELGLNSTLSPSETERGVNELRARDGRKEFIVSLLFWAFCGTVLAIGLSTAEPLVTRNGPGVLVNGSLGGALGLGPVMFRYDLHMARADRDVAPFKLLNICVDMLPEERKAYQRLTRRVARRLRLLGWTDGDPMPGDIQVLLQRRARVAALARGRVPGAVKVALGHRGSRTLIFHEDTASADRIVAALKEHGLSAALYHTGIGAALRRSNLRLYRRGVFDVLACCRARGEGVNIPETQVAVIASAPATTRRRVQRLGRVLRPAPGKDRAVVYTLYATEAERKRLEREGKELQGTAEVRWFEVSRSDGADSHRGRLV